MAKRGNDKKQPVRFLGNFELAHKNSFTGELLLDGTSTILRLHAEQPFPAIEGGRYVTGVSFTGERLTLIDCQMVGSGSTFQENRAEGYQAEIFPHHVAVGRRHLRPADAIVRAISFTTTDLPTLFYDYDAFGHMIEDASPIMDTVLKRVRDWRPVECGEHPQIFYFTGKYCIASVCSAVGTISIRHRPSWNMGGPSGINIKNRITVSIEPDNAVSFDDALRRMYAVTTFLSMAAGRAQGIRHVTIETIDGEPHEPLKIYPSFQWEAGGNDEAHKPHPGDLPLNPIEKQADFESVLCNWIERNQGWKIARGRYLDCLRNANHYNADRIVAAANMFDILPLDAVPLRNNLPNDVALARDACRAIFRKLPEGIDRNSALDALGRLGKPSLPKKVAHRASIVASKLGKAFPDLDFVASVGVKCRNFYVHGSSSDIDYSKVESFIPFLTDTLEFIFAASDFIESGWDPRDWNARAFGHGHSFTRFKAEYSSALRELRKALAA